MDDLGLQLGSTFFMRWESDSAFDALTPVVIYKVELLEDLDPLRLKATVRRKKISDNGSTECQLKLTRQKGGKSLSITFFESGMEVIWALEPKSKRIITGSSAFFPGDFATTV